MSTQPSFPLPALLDEVRALAVERMQERLRAAGYADVRPSHGCVFRFIDRKTGSRLTELAELSGLTKQSVGEVVADLEEMGYVQRAADPSDRRAKTIMLTERGHAASTLARQLFDDIEAGWAAEVGEELVGCMRAAAERIVELEHERAPQRLTRISAGKAR